MASASSTRYSPRTGGAEKAVVTAANAFNNASNISEPHTRSHDPSLHLQETVQHLFRFSRHLERGHERQGVVINELRSHLQRIEDQISKIQTDMAYTQQQLEYMVVSLERERGIVADHTEQLRLFASESTRRRNNNEHDADQKSFVMILANWMYNPIVQFAKGVYTLFSPLINTAQSLSLLNSEVLQRCSDEPLRSKWGNAKKGDLLVLLQDGALDPATLNGRKTNNKRQE